MLVSVLLGLACVAPNSSARSAPSSFASPHAGSVAAGGAASTEVEGVRLARRWAPAFLQHTTSDHPERDRPLRVDIDGDWDATNNWSGLTAAAARSVPAVYFAAILTETHAYLTYTLFYPRDWSQSFCLPYVCHDNDLESALVVVERSEEASPQGERLVLVETKAHHDYIAVAGAEVARGSQGQPLISIESEGHGMRAVRSGDPPPPSRGALLLIEATTPRAENPRSSEPYDLVPTRETLWAKRHAGPANERLWTRTESGSFDYSGVRLGQLGYPLGALMAGSEYPGGVRPPWALAAGSARGDWFIDPAFETLARYRDWFARPSPSTRYVWNPYLDDLTRECSGSGCVRPPPVVAAAAPADGGALAVLGFLLLRVVPRLNARFRRGPRRQPGP
jgi:hypothetical protein